MPAPRLHLGGVVAFAGAHHDIGTADGAPYIVTELLEGETLRERALKAPLKLGESLDIATQIASALAAARHHPIAGRDPILRFGGHS